MRLWAILAVSVALASPTLANVTKVIVLEGILAFSGLSFGNVGPYRCITARAMIPLDPCNPRNTVITDLGLAPRNTNGKAEAILNLVILCLSYPARSNGTLLAAVPNW